MSEEIAGKTGESEDPGALELGAIDSTGDDRAAAAEPPAELAS